MHLGSSMLRDARVFCKFQFLSQLSRSGHWSIWSGLREKPTFFIGIPVEVLVESLVFS